MKAAVIYENGGPEVLRYEDVPDPECPEGFVLLDVAASSIEGGDLLARASSPPPARPHIVGYLCAGTAIEVGAGVESPAVGDMVVALNADGSHAEKRAVPAAVTWPVPEGLDPAAAACVPVAFGTAQECLFTAASLDAEQMALIHAGAGGVGMAAIQLAKKAGATVISTASSDEKLERLRPLGLDHGINYASESFVDRVRELTDGRGVDVALDSIGEEPGGQHRGARVPRDARQRRSGRPSRLGSRGPSHCERRTTRYAACTSAARSSPSTRASTR
jgi:NADPH2:quinone reductase